MPLTPDLVPLQQALLGRYSIELELGRGGMGTVYLARDIRLDRLVAIKVLHPDLAANPDARSRFLQEARTAAGLAHPHIVPIFAVEQLDSFAIIVMESIVGETLGARIRRRGALGAEEVERVLREIAWALGYAHAHGVIHRDLTLENVLLEDATGRALLADFGLAGEHASATEPRFGTPGFLSPEVIRGEVADTRSDLYALGVVCWTALTGKAPFVAETPAQLLAKHVVQLLPPIGRSARGASRRLVGAIESCLAKHPDSRPADTRTLIDMLERAPEPVTIAPPLARWFNRWERIAPIHSIATPLMAMQTWAMAMSYYSGGRGYLKMAAVISATFSLTLIPFGIQLLFEVREMRRLRAAGFTIDDIRTALPFREEELVRSHEHEGLRPLASRVIFDLTVVAVLTSVIVGLIVEPYQKSFDSAIDKWLIGLVGAGPTIYLAAMIGIGIGFVSPGFRLGPLGLARRLISRFWHSAIAKRFSQVAGMAQRNRLIATATLHRPTAMVLGLAVDDLWKAMPESLREGLGDVPGLAHTLQSGASELRLLMDQITSSEGDLDGDTDDVAHLRVTWTQLQSQHREAVATLEKLRLQLLRLLVSRQHTSELTQELDAARTLEIRLLGEVAGHREVRHLLGRSRVRRRSSLVTPTPVTP